MKRLLCIVGGMNVGGAETFLMKVYRKLDRTKYQMDFAVAIDEDGAYDTEIERLGGKIYHITPKSKSIIRNFRDIQNLVKNECYDYVLRTSQHSLSALELLAARRGGAGIRVFRSSNSNTTSGGKKELMLHRFFRFMPERFANVRFAPSTEAAEYMFGKDCIERGSACIVHNGIDLSVYRYDKDGREKIRREFGIPENALLVGHIGRFTRQKNHAFLLDIFKDLCEKNENAVLILVGKGELKESIREKAEHLGIKERVIFAGVRTDIPALLSAMDVFVFPSLYEGMPNAVIEAQATGLPCFVSDTITREADIAGLVSYLPLGDAAAWASRIAALPFRKRTTPLQDFVTSGYDMETVTGQFVKLIFRE